MDKRTLDLYETADFLKVSPATAQEMAATGELPGAKIGRAWVFLLDDLVDWLREQVKIQRGERKERRPPPVEAAILQNHRIDRKTRRRKPPNLPKLPSEVGSA